MTFPKFAVLPPGFVISTLTRHSLGNVRQSSPGSAVFPASNRAIYIPFRLNAPIVAELLFVLNGAAVSGNIDVGIYDKDGTRLISTGSTAQSGISSLQTFNITDTRLDMGLFYLAVAMDNTTGALIRTNQAAAAMRMQGCAQQASAFALPAAATFAAVATAYAPIIGLAARPVL